MSGRFYAIAYVYQSLNDDGCACRQRQPSRCWESTTESRKSLALSPFIYLVIWFGVWDVTTMSATQGMWSTTKLTQNSISCSIQPREAGSYAIMRIARIGGCWRDQWGNTLAFNIIRISQVILWAKQSYSTISKRRRAVPVPSKE